MLPIMVPKKPSNSGSLSPENDQHDKDKSLDDTTGVGRSYECNFCKRGFTNAQALGGHMNIHRKDKAKAKQKNREEPSSNKPNLRYHTQISTSDHHKQISGYYGAQMNYQVYLGPSANPSFQSGNSYLPVWRPEYYEGHVDANLSLGIGGASRVVEDGDHMIVKENELDLELRLGHDP